MRNFERLEMIRENLKSDTKNPKEFQNTTKKIQEKIYNFIIDNSKTIEIPFL